jgi:hypothetical protein
MKCEACRELLEEYLDGELPPQDRELVDAHLTACVDCSESFAALTAEQELFARYDREIEVPPFLWTRVAAHTVSEKQLSKAGWRKLLSEMFATPGAVMAGAIVFFAFAVMLALSLGSDAFYHAAKGTGETQTRTDPPYNPKPETPRKEDEQPPIPPQDEVKQPVIAYQPKRKPRVKAAFSKPVLDQSDVLSSDLAFLDMEEQDTAKHIEQSKILLRSIKNVQISDTDDEIDVTYDKALSRRLLNENVVLRRDAEMKAKFPTKTLLADLEPFLIDIANLPDRARPEDVRVIKERVQKTEIVAALLDYQDRGTNNR